MKSSIYFGSEEEQEQLASSLFSGTTSRPEEDEEKNLVEYVKQFVARQYDNQLIFANGTFYAYRQGYWPALDEQADVRKTIVIYLGKRAKPNLVNSYVSLLQDLYSEKALAQPGGLICLANGTLNPESGQLLEHSPEHRLRTKLDVAWDRDATCPQFVKALDAMFSVDADKADKISCIQQFFGYCLVPDTSMHKFLWCVGQGGNGKSVLLEVLTSLVGEQNVSHAHIDRLEEKDVRAELEGRLVNISFEMTSDATLSGGHFKAIVSGDRIEARRLYQRSFSFKPFIRLVCATNELPRLNDLTGGFSRRAIIIRFNRVFKEHEQDKNLVTKLMAELSGILAWAVQGLQELRSHGRFTIPASSVDELHQYRKEADSVQLFVEDEFVPVTTGGHEPSHLYSEYKAWCESSGFKPVNIVNFGKRLKKIGIDERKSNGRKYWLVDRKRTTMQSPTHALSVPKSILRIRDL